jgi:uncharacterized DUF497 family protein
MLIDIDSLRALCTNSTLIITSHASEQMMKRGIKYRHIKAAIQSGEIIEEYPDEMPDPRVLVFGYTDEKHPLHIVIGVGDWDLRVITAYHPTTDKWEPDFKTRKVEQ